MATLAIGHAAPIREATMYRLVSLAALTFCLTTILVPAQLVARDDGRFANSPLKPWFDRLASGKAYAVLLPTASVCKMSTGTPRMGTTACVPDDAVVTPLCGPITTFWQTSARLRAEIAASDAEDRCAERRRAAWGTDERVTAAKGVMPPVIS